ncbi:hypothetical protein [Oleomonas cavernae]|uniref:hypothetical protein n=1 Tax=Oleomonas cavernae TaxID=2320859 RepID=UPI0018F3C9FC|nr:hypothetical protein [Oleomonas cavernae]
MSLALSTIQRSHALAAEQAADGRADRAVTHHQTETCSGKAVSAMEILSFIENPVE